MAQPLRIDFVSDIACPWCVIGLRSLMKALDELGGDVEAEILFQPFELNPDMPPEGENTTDHVARKYGSTRAQSSGVRNVIREHGEAVGFTFNFTPESRIWNTFDAHRLLYWAGVEGRQLELKQALFEATFTRQLPSNDRNALTMAAEEAGLDPAKAREVLESGAFADEVRHEEDVWRERGVHAVPSIVFNGKWMIQGGQPAETFVKVIRSVLAQSAAQQTGAPVTS